jgi:hypothetical protein
MYYKEAYDKATGILDRDVKLLFQRLNFFLVAMAFLVAGFAAVFGAGQNSRALLNIDYVISGAGFFASIFFASINYLNTRIIRQTGRYIRELEGMKFGELVDDTHMPYARVEQIVQEEMNRRTTLILLPLMLRQLFNVLFRPRHAAKENIADHVYIVPLGFSLFWLCLIAFLILLAFGKFS